MLSSLEMITQLQNATSTSLSFLSHEKVWKRKGTLLYFQLGEWTRDTILWHELFIPGWGKVRKLRPMPFTSLKRTLLRPANNGCNIWERIIDKTPPYPQGGMSEESMILKSYYANHVLSETFAAGGKGNLRFIGQLWAKRAGQSPKSAFTIGRSHSLCVRASMFVCVRSLKRACTRL